MTVSPQLRAILLASVLAATALALGFYTLSQSNKGGGGADEALPPPASLASPTAHPGSKPTAKAAAKHATTAQPAVKAKVRPAARPKPKPQPNPFVVAAKTAGMPPAIASALGAHEVVVAALYMPGLKIDTTTRAEAQAGAATARVGFIAVDAHAQGTALALTKSLGVLDAPGVLVFRRPGELFVRLDGFSDRETVAQAAHNADPTPGGVDKSAWSRDANTICAEGDKQIAGLPVASTEAQQLAVAPRLQSIENDTKTKLRGLTPARGTAPRVDRMLGSWDRMEPVRVEWIGAVSRGDKVKAASLETQLQALGARGDRLAASLGAGTCSMA